MAKKENFIQRFRRFADETGKYVTGNSEVNPFDRGPRSAPSPSLKPFAAGRRFPGESDKMFQIRLERLRKMRQARQQ